LWISCGSVGSVEASTDLTDHQLITEVITFKPLQREELGATDPTDLLFATSKKFPTDEDVENNNFDAESVQNFQK
jgi:hypothetical protein